MYIYWGILYSVLNVIRDIMYWEGERYLVHASVLAAMLHV